MLVCFLNVLVNFIIGLNFTFKLLINITVSKNKGLWFKPRNNSCSWYMQWYSQVGYWGTGYNLFKKCKQFNNLLIYAISHQTPKPHQSLLSLVWQGSHQWLLSFLFPLFSYGCIWAWVPSLKTLSSVHDLRTSIWQKEAILVYLQLQED